MGCDWHASTSKGTITWRRHFPIWMTSGMLGPIGTLSSSNLPSGPLSAIATGLPVTSEPHWSQVTPVGSVCSEEFGT